ncbi:MAG: hypothetical protein E7060_00775 [Treponema bryantii]|nr:hypothetical protein [Treponema bryantii]
MKKEVTSKDFLSPVFYSVFISQLPNLKYEEIKEAAKYKIKNLYPGNIDNIELFIKKNGSIKNSYIILAIEKKILNDDKPISFLYLFNENKDKNNNLIFISDDYIELLEIENFSLRKYTTFSLGKYESFDNFINEQSIDTNNFNIIDVSNGKKILINEKKCLLTKIFHKSSLKMSLKIFLVSLCLLLSVVVFSMLYVKMNRDKKIEAEISAKLIEEQDKANKEKLRLLDSLKKDYLLVQKSTKRNVYEILFLLTNKLSIDTKILQIDIIGNTFKFEAISKDSLQNLRNFEQMNDLESCMIHQVKPIDNMEKYTLSGNVKNNFYTPDGNLSVNEQIDWYKNALHELEKKEKKLNEISISSLGDYIRENILIYKGEITSFQYIQNQSSNEMEFAFTTDSKNFFSIISLLSDKQQLFTITKFSIKTGVADGASVIFRIDVGGSKKGTTEYKSQIQNEIFIEEENIKNIARFFAVDKKTKITPTTSVKIKEKELEQIPNAPRDYVFVSEVDDSKIYVKNTSTNQLIKLELTKDGNMGYFYNDKGELIILMDNKKYRLVR